MTYKKKLIEVALPLDVINQESAREKSIRQGHPSTVHLWWARRPLAACRAVIFASIVDDPSSHPEEFPSSESQEKERKRLFKIIERLVQWENSNDRKLLEQARAEIAKSTGGSPPRLLDPFCGGGSIPLEGQRLGLPVDCSDLNPVAVLITRALVEIPPKFAGRPPANQVARAKLETGGWKGAHGLAEDVRHYGEWIRTEAFRRIGHHYPRARDSAGEATVIAWLWVRTLKCPNPGCGGHMPLARSFDLFKKSGKRAWVEPIVNDAEKTVRFEVRTGEGGARPGTKLRGRAECLFCGLNNISDAELRQQAKTFGLGAQMLAVVAEGPQGRTYLSPEDLPATEVSAPNTDWMSQPLPTNARWFSPPGYGMTTYRDLFTERQILALTTFSDLVAEARDRAYKDAVAAGMQDNGASLADGGDGAAAYADAVATYLAFAIDKGANLWSTITSWMSDRGALRETFARQAIPMVWDFAEANPFSDSGGSYLLFLDRVVDVIRYLPQDVPPGRVSQLDATAAVNGVDSSLVCTDPPYYDNIGYSDLSDYFYVWLRRSLKEFFPSLFATLLTPKDQELVATPFRFGGSKQDAERFFETGLRAAFNLMFEKHDAQFPLTLFYAFKQSESDGDQHQGTEAIASTGWETMLEGLLSTGFSITATWPMRTESPGRAVAKGTNALASSIAIACRPRAASAPLATRKEFLAGLRSELPEALRLLQHGNVAPVDLAQASIGPGMAVFSRFSRVIEADGSPMRVRTALELINQTLTEVLSHLEDEFDSSTRWAISWFEQYAMTEGPYGEADVLARAKGVAVNGLVQDGIVVSGRGKVRLLRPEELKSEWNPTTDARLRAWEVTHHLVRALGDGGEEATASILRAVGPSFGDLARDLAYRLYNTCERKRWTQEAMGYNQLVVAWPEVQRLAGRDEGPQQQMLG